MKENNCRCLNCNNEFYKEPSQQKKTKMNFCSRACYGTYLKTNPTKKASVEYFCIKCDISLGIGYKNVGQKKLCKNCNTNYRDWSTVTISEYKKENSDIYQFHSKIRSLARTIYKNSNKPKKCCNCNYDKHYEVCHIKSVSDFQDTEKISIVNDIDNLIGLCPNCHWEFDNNLLILSGSDQS